MPAERGRVKFHVARGGAASELRQFLSDVEDAYTALARFELLGRARLRTPFIPIWLYELGVPYAFSDVESLLPSEFLEVSSAEFASPGAWEFLGALNPLKELREYLKDRHERRKDEWRNPEEKRRLELENDLLQERLRSERLGSLQKTVDLLKEAGVPEEEIQRFLWKEIGLPLSRVGRHQDTGLLTDQSEPNGD